jgi:hypothetical protein
MGNNPHDRAPTDTDHLDVDAFIYPEVSQMSLTPSSNSRRLAGLLFKFNPTMEDFSFEESGSFHLTRL